MKKLLMFLFFYCFVMTGIAAPVVLDVPVPDGDATPVLRGIIEQASSYKGRAVLIRLQQGDYHIYRTSSSPYLYYISNTASAEENPDPTKHIGIWLKDMKNITVDGGGARFVTHGEMTPFVIDGCENVTLKNFSLVAADPSVPEMTVVSTDANSITARVTAGSSYEIEDGKFYWKGEGWRFGGGIAQVFYPQTNVTNRCESPLAGVTKAIELDEGLVRFMHGQSYGFEAFYKGDEVEFVDAHSLRCLQPACVKAVERIDDYEILLTLDRAVNDNVKTAENVSVENVTWTPEVEIRNNYFSRIPTRGILVTTRRKVVIEDNVFYRIPMSGVLVSDDARGWYESGPVRDVTIRRNLFMECGSPVIAMMPENDRYEGAVHRNVRIEANRFVIRQGSEAVSARATDGLIIRDNYISVAGDGPVSPDAFFRTEDCKDVTISGNRCGRSLLR